MSLEVKDNDWATSAGHWYKPDGTPAYTMIGANGKERNTTLRDAKKLGLFPSVSTISKMEAAPGLEIWKIRQACLACLTLPRNPGEDEDAFMSRALADSKEQARKAAERGTYLHGVLEKYFRHDGLPSDEDAPYVDPAIRWIESTLHGYAWSAERSFSSPKYRFGGKLDLYGQIDDITSVVIDAKFKDFSDSDKKLAYDEHCTQLAAYRALVNPLLSHRTRCLNIFVSTKVPGLFVPHEWGIDELDKGFEAFAALRELYRVRKGI